MECLFSKRELRLLDDLLPETNKNMRKGMIGQISKISKHNKAKDWHKDDLILQREALKLEMERAKKHLRKKAKELGLELEGVQFKKEKRREDSLAAGIMSEKARKSSGVEKLAKKSRRMTMMTPDGQIRSRYNFSEKQSVKRI